MDIISMILATNRKSGSGGGLSTVKLTTKIPGTPGDATVTFLSEEESNLLTNAANAGTACQIIAALTSEIEGENPTITAVYNLNTVKSGDELVSLVFICHIGLWVQIFMYDSSTNRWSAVQMGSS